MPSPTERSGNLSLVQLVGNGSQCQAADRGAQYGSLLVGRTLREAAIIPSMGRVGDPWDNALMESAIGTIKAELVNGHVFQTRDQARLAVFDYIEALQPDPRPQRPGALSPDEYEAEYQQTHAVDNQAA